MIEVMRIDAIRTIYDSAVESGDIHTVKRVARTYGHELLDIAIGGEPDFLNTIDNEIGEK